jgi:hypothetical protein
MDFICLGIRVPKSGSSSLGHALRAAFADRRTFYLPDTLNHDGQISAFQAWRFRRAQRRALRANYGNPDLGAAFGIINAQATPGDLVAGGHFDFRTARAALALPVRTITILRHPVDRCISEYNYARQGYIRRDLFKRVDSKVLAKVSARYSLLGYLDWLIERRSTYGDIASQLLGWDGTQPVAAYLSDTMFHAGVLEQVDAFAFGLSEKLGRTVDFPWDNSTLVRKEQGASAEAQRRIETLYARDFELYEQVRSGGPRMARRASARPAELASPRGAQPASPPGPALN